MWKKNRKRVENAIAMLSLDLKMQINVRFCHFLVLPRHEFVTGHVKYTPSPPPSKFFFHIVFVSTAVWHYFCRWHFKCHI